MVSSGKRIWGESEEAKILRYRAKGFSTSEIRKQFAKYARPSNSLIRSTLESHGIAPIDPQQGRPTLKRVWGEDAEKKVLRKYAEGRTIGRIRRAFPCYMRPPLEFVSAVLETHGLSPHPGKPMGRPRKAREVAN